VTENRWWLAKPQRQFHVCPASPFIMTAQEYIQKKLDTLKEPVPDGSELKGTPEEIVYARLMSKKFRKIKAAQPCIDITKRVVEKAVRDQTPIMVTECFGGNKLWRFDEAPEIDWAELFSLIYFLEWMKYVAAVHKPGMIFDYFSQDLSVERLDNLTREELDAYSRTFQAMLEWIEPYLPENVSVTYRRHRDMFDDESKYDVELADAKQKYLDEHDGKLPVLTEEMKTRTELNVRLLNGQDQDPQWREKTELQHQAIFMTPTLGTYLTFPEMVWTCPTYYDDSIVTGSTKKSMAKFWAGVGALEKSGDSYNELVLTPKQLSSAQFDWEAVHLDGLQGKNFSKIRVLK
jgi:hypothetical protein